MAEPLRILYISHYFPPEVNAPAVRVSEMADHWAHKGIDVTVLTCFPNHPFGVIPEEYKGLIHAREKHGGVKVIRTYVYAAANKGFFKRILNYLSFMMSSVLFGLPGIGKPDIIIATSPQFFVAVAGYVISLLKRCKFVFEVRDLWPEEIVAVGALKNRLAIRLLEAVEVFLYRKADLIVAVARGTIDTILKRGIPESKMTLVPNGVDIDRFQSAPDGRQTKKQHGLEGKFVVGYIGTHGMAHRLDITLDAAALMQKQDDIRFLFVGDGAEKASLVTKARESALENVVFLDQVDRLRVPSFYKACDVCLVPLRKADLFTRNIPSKIYEIMASGRPIIISTDGESRRLVESAGAGIAARPEDASDLAEKICYLRDNQKVRENMGRSGQAFVLANFSRAYWADEYLRALERVARGRGLTIDTNKTGHMAEDKYGSKEKAKASF